MKRVWWGCGTAVVLCLLVAGCGAALWYAVPSGEDLRRPYVDDPRACPRSNVGLAEATTHFGLVLPDDARDVRFSSDVHPLFGEVSLVVAFRTDRAGLRTFLEASQLPQPESESGALTGDASCGLTPDDFTDPVYAETPLTESHPYTKKVAVDRADPERPRVLVEAFDV